MASAMVSEQVSSEEASSERPNLVVIYPGRFQPFGPHHAETYTAIKEYIKTKKGSFSRIDFFIATSPKEGKALYGDIRNPFGFELKKKVIMAHDISAEEIKGVAGTLYDINIELPDLVPYVNENTIVVYMIGEKDRGERFNHIRPDEIVKNKVRPGIAKQQDFDTYFNQSIKGKGQESWKNRDFIHFIEVDVGKQRKMPHGKDMSGTELRNDIKSLNSDEQGLKTLKQIMGFTKLNNAYIRQLFDELRETLIQRDIEMDEKQAKKRKAPKTKKPKTKKQKVAAAESVAAKAAGVSAAAAEPEPAAEGSKRYLKHKKKTKRKLKRKTKKNKKTKRIKRK